MNETIRNKVSSLNQPQTMCLRVGRLLLHNILGFRRSSFLINLSIVQLGCDCHPHCIKRIAAADQYKEFNSCHSYKKVDSKDRSLTQIQRKLTHEYRQLLHNNLGFHCSLLT